MIFSFSLFIIIIILLVVHFKLSCRRQKFSSRSCDHSLTHGRSELGTSVTPGMQPLLTTDTLLQHVHKTHLLTSDFICVITCMDTCTICAYMYNVHMYICTYDMYTLCSLQRSPRQNRMHIRWVELMKA